MKKQLTIMADLSQKRAAQGRCISVRELDSKELFEFFPEFRGSSPIQKLFDLPRCKHIIICVFESLSGDVRRRICGLDQLTPEDGLQAVIAEVANSIGINIDRTLVIHNGGLSKLKKSGVLGGV